MSEASEKSSNGEVNRAAATIDESRAGINRQYHDGRRVSDAGINTVNNHPLIELTKVRLREFVREKEAVFWVFVFPVLLACALGIAFRNTGPEKSRVGVEAGATAESRARAERIVAALASTPDIEPLMLTPDEAAKALRSGNVALVVRAGEGSGETFGVGEQQSAPHADAGLVYRFDPSRPESRAAQLGVDAALSRAEGRHASAGAREERVTEQGGRYIDFLIPGLIGLNLMGSGMWGIGFTIVTARGRKLLKLFAATPMRRSHYLLSFMLSRLGFLLIEVGALLLFGWLAFGVTVRGSVALVFAVAVIGGMAFSGIGLLVAARPTTIEGVSGLMNFVMLPMWLLSGTFFSSERFPDFIQPAIRALPLTALNDSLRAIINEGASLTVIWMPLAVLITWGLVSFVGALRMFRWQ